MQITATDIRKGHVLVYNGQLCRVVSVTHLTPGNKRGQVQAKMKNIETGSNVENRFRSDASVEKAHLDTHEMEYLYEDGGSFHFMNTANYEQVELSGDVVGDATDYLLPNTTCKVQFYEGRAMGIELPQTVDLTVTETEPSLKTATVTSSLKPAVCETGLKTSVPQFIQTGEVITVNTESGEYISRAKG